MPRALRSPPDMPPTARYLASSGALISIWLTDTRAYLSATPVPGKLRRPAPAEVPIDGRNTFTLARAYADLRRLGSVSPSTTSTPSDALARGTVRAAFHFADDDEI